MNENLARQLSMLPEYLGWHVLLSLIALAVGILISLPVGIFIARSRALATMVLTPASVIQTIPSMALLALMFPLLVLVRDLLPEQWQFRALGFWPTIIALTLYSLLPVLRNTVAAIQGVDPAMTEAARGIGMTPGQRMRRVELPLAAPVIIAGIRTATVWTVGIATLSTPIGQTSLGNYIFGGLQTQNTVAIVVGCVSAAVLAIALDFLIAGLQRSSETRNPTLGVSCGLGLVVVLASGLAGLWLSSESVDVNIGAKNFNEQFILAEVIEDRLEAHGLNAGTQESLGSLNVFNALASGEIDVYVDYSGTIWANAMSRQDMPGRQAVLDEMGPWLREEHDIVMLGTLGFENAYALALREQRAEELGVTTIAELSAHAPQLELGSDIEFFERPEWQKLRDTYNLQFESLVPMSPTMMYPAVAENEVDVITAFTSDGRIASYELRVLEDPRGAFPPYDAILLLSARAAQDPRIIEALQPLIGKIDVEMMREANLMVDRSENKQTPEQAAHWLLQQMEGVEPAP